MFSGLKEADLLAIIDIMIHRLDVRLKQKNIAITIDKKAKTELAHRGFDKAYGARPLERLIQKEVVDKVAMGIIEQRFFPGEELLVTFDGKDFIVKKNASPA
jgi:ATP-dependent Clp protease ATP-binding subunit ClpA